MMTLALIVRGSLSAMEVVENFSEVKQMRIQKFEETIIPQTDSGQRLADEFVERLKRQHAFVSREETTTQIIIKARYSLRLSDYEVGKWIKK